MNIKCLICGKDFLNYRNIKKFCSKDCFLKNQKIYNKNYFKNYIVKAETLIRIKEYNDKYNKKKRDLTNEARKSKGLPDLKPKGYWTKARVLEDALNYKTKSEWVNASSAAHNAANKLGIFEEATKHMLVLGNSHKRCIYSIKLPKQNLAYIGLTFNEVFPVNKVSISILSSNCLYFVFAVQLTRGITNSTSLPVIFLAANILSHADFSSKEESTMEFGEDSFA